VSGGDEGTTVAALRASVARFVEERDWKQFHAPKNLAMALACEAAELMEHYLWVEAADSVKVTEDAAKKAKVAAEMADVAMCLLNLSNVTGIDLAAAVEAKLAEAAKKYPVDVVKGQAKKYDEY
jgi:dCTP diphosphatase